MKREKQIKWSWRDCVSGYNLCMCFFGIIRYIERANQKIAKKNHKNKKQIQKKRKGESTNTNRKKEEKNIKIGETDTSCELVYVLAGNYTVWPDEL